ncbi:hypothetical protein FRC09_011691 [Ceratobasidium sp. 395]|nr:hypothetical protein FRC09_011691 [Ceratobasidium sp. 395]
MEPEWVYGSGHLASSQLSSGDESWVRVVIVTESGGVGRKHERRRSLDTARTGSGAAREELVRSKTAGDGWGGSVGVPVEEGESGTKGKIGGGEKEREESAAVGMQPVYLKGLFSIVVTISTKPARTIKANVKRVLNRMQVYIVDTFAIASNNKRGEGAPPRRRRVVRKGLSHSFGKKGPPASVVVAENDKDKEEVGGGNKERGGGKELEKEMKKRRCRSSLSFAGVKGQEGTKDSGRMTPDRGLLRSDPPTRSRKPSLLFLAILVRPVEVVGPEGRLRWT